MVENDKPAWDEMLWSIKTGENAFRHTHDGMSEFEFFEANPDREVIFSRAMHEVDSLGERCSILV